MNELQLIQSKIYEIRGQKVMLDFDLAEMYGTETKRLKEAVKRNIRRFPPDFMFELTQSEFLGLRSQIASSKGRGGIRYCHSLLPNKALQCFPPSFTAMLR